jgi:hypothetical protein
MKKIMYMFLGLCLVSCSSSDNGKKLVSDRSDTTNGVGVDFRLVHVPIPFSGIWVNEKYVVGIKKDKSPRVYQNVAESVIVPDSTLQDIRGTSGFHEGSEGGLEVVKNGDHFELYDKDSKGRSKKIDIITADKINIGDESFIKLKHPDEKKYDWNILEELVFSGRYRRVDGSEAEFKLDGRVSGLDSFTHYVPMIDYIGPGMNVDQVELGVREDQMETFGYRFKTDTLFIYALHCLEGYDSASKECGVVEFGDLRYKLFRKG